MSNLDSNNISEQEFLQHYDPQIYPRPSMAADIVIFTVAQVPEQNYRKLAGQNLQILLIRRGVHPFLGNWALPGGFVRPGESVDMAANRELLEETGVSGGYLEQLYTFSQPERDPRTWVISCAHMALMDSASLSLEAGDDAADAKWFQVEYRLLEETRTSSPTHTNCIRKYQLTLTNEDTILTAVIEQITGRNSLEFHIAENHGLAFDHAKIIACAIARLRNKLDYTDIALNLMPEQFTLTQLQQVYEGILGKPLLKAAFRRKIAPLVLETGQYTENKGHRPSQLFVRNWEGGSL